MDDSTIKKLTVSEYSQQIGKSKQSIYNRIKRGTLKSENIDGVSYVYVDSTIVKPIKPLNTTINNETTQPIEKFNRNEIFILKRELKEYKKMLKECRATIKTKDKEIKRLNKSLYQEKDSSIDILKQFIGEMKVLSHKSNVVETEIIEEEEINQKKKKKKKK